MHIHPIIHDPTRTNANRGSWIEDKKFSDFIKAMRLDELLTFRERFVELRARDLNLLNRIIRDKVRQISNWNNDAALKHYFESLHSNLILQDRTRKFIDELDSPELLEKFDEIIRSREGLIQERIRSMTIDQLVELAERFPPNYGFDIPYYISFLGGLNQIRERFGNNC